MSKFDPSITNVKFEKDILSFNISGSESYGLDKSMINCIRRTILSDIPSIAFRVDENIKKDIKINENTGSIHNEMLLQRISLIPLYINPENYNNNYLFELKVNHDNDSTYKFITSDDFNIYPLLPKIQNQLDNSDETTSELQELLNKKDINNYDLKNQISKKIKDGILRPFIFKNKKNYCLITELKNTNTSNTSQSIHLYGIPSVSTSMENSRYQSVSLATYSFTKDEDLINSIIADRISLEKISEENKESFAQKIHLSESERYYKRDLENEPNCYDFSIKSCHYYSAGEIFIKSLNIIIDKLDNLKLELLNLLKDKDSSISVEKKNEIIFHINIHEEGHTIGNLIQGHIVRRCINDDSILLTCGYKKIHPLENLIKLIISLNPSNKIIKETEINKFQMVITFLIEQLETLKQQFKTILKISESSDLIKE